METHLLVRRHAPMRNQDPLIVETLVEVLAQDGIQLHTNPHHLKLLKMQMALLQ